MPSATWDKGSLQSNLTFLVAIIGQICFNSPQLVLAEDFDLFFEKFPKTV
jgi:hypothetical protein